jgi:hypothetical protein
MIFMGPFIFPFCKLFLKWLILTQIELYLAKYHFFTTRIYRKTLKRLNFVIIFLKKSKGAES